MKMSKTEIERVKEARVMLSNLMQEFEVDFSNTDLYDKLYDLDVGEYLKYEIVAQFHVAHQSMQTIDMVGGALDIVATNEEKYSDKDLAGALLLIIKGLAEIAQGQLNNIRDDVLEE